MNVYCKMCMNKDREEMCRTCVSDVYMTTDGIKYGLLSNYSCIFKQEIPPQEVAEYCDNDVRATKAAFNAFFGAGRTASPCQKAMYRIKNVIFNDPATIVFWNDGTKTVVKCGKDDAFDPEKGLAMAISKYFFDNAGYFNDVFKKWIPKKGESDEKDQ